jgi:hypothetical protein
MFCPGSKIAFMVSGSRKMVELLYAFQHMDDPGQILHLDLQVVEGNAVRRKRNYDEVSLDVPQRSGPWDKAEVICRSK